jgi:Flp pilus assembly protein TadB
LRTSICRMLITSLACILALMVQSSSLSAAQEHVVSSAELEQATVAASRSRQQNISKVEKFFASKHAEAALKSAHLDPVQVSKAVPTLSDQELARLASRVDKAQKDFAAGALTNQQITYILIALATAVVVLIATH